MPQTKKKKKAPGQGIMLPTPMIEEIDRVVWKFPIYGNRQQFVESSIREKVEKIRQFEAGLPSVE